MTSEGGETFSQWMCVRTGLFSFKRAIINICLITMHQMRMRMREKCEGVKGAACSNEPAEN